MRKGRFGMAGVQWTGAVACLVAGLLLVAAPPSIAPAFAQVPPAGGTDRPVSTNILARIYQSGYARLSRGDANGAMSAFQVVSETAPELGEASYALALATVLADFGKRERALPLANQAMAEDPANPLGAVVAVLADPKMSTLRSDGALYLSAAGTDKIRAASPLLQNYPAARNGRYAAAFLNSLETTNDRAFPARFANFNRMVGQGGKIRLKSWDTDLIFGQLFLVTVADTRFSPFEQRLIARLQDGLKSLESNNSNLSRVRARIQQLRARLDSNDPAERTVALAGLDKLLSDLDDIIVQNETTIASLKVIVENVGVDQELAKKKEEIKKEEERITAMRHVGTALAGELEQKKQAISEAERKRLDTLNEVNLAQKKLNALEGRLAHGEAQLASTDQTALQAERSMRERGVKLAELTRREEALKKQIAAGGAADFAKQLAAVQAEKATLENDMHADESNLARLRAERDSLRAEVEGMRRQQEKQVADRARVAQLTKEVNFGHYYALVIGNNEYREWPKLHTAVNDAKSIAEVLEKKYGFTVKLVTNATRKDVIGAFEEMRDQLGANDNLLIYYAGHGIVENNRSYWVPVDGDAYIEGRPLQTRNLVTSEEVIGTIQKLRAKQVLVVADSCFSGGLAIAASMAGGPPLQTAMLNSRGVHVVQADGNAPIAALQGIVVRADAPEELIAMQHWASRAARVVLTSGGNEPVVDQIKSTDQHSIFAQAMLGALQKNQGLLKSIELTNTVQEQVISKIGGALRRGGNPNAAVLPQTPTLANMMGYNGEFLFVARN
jgi:caspase domain-containing protein